LLTTKEAALFHREGEYSSSSSVAVKCPADKRRRREEALKESSWQVPKVDKRRA
jgi:hypothetical protein